MKDLIEALIILSKYTDDKYPSWCELDVFHICVDPSVVSSKDITRLEELGFEANYADKEFYSYRFGSC